MSAPDRREPPGHQRLRIPDGLTAEHLGDSAGQPWSGRTFQVNPFAGDDGAQQPGMSAALTCDDPGERLEAVVTELRTGRVLVPVVAHEHPGTGEDGAVAAHDATKFRSDDPAADACASAAMVSVRTADGRAALPVFSSLAALQRWDASARPVPVEAVRAALAAAGETDGLLILDPGSDPAVLVPRPAVWALARRQPWTPSWSDPELPAVVARALAGIDGLVGVRLLRGIGPDSGGVPELRVLVAVAPGLDRDVLRMALGRASQALSEDEQVRERVDSLELYPVPSTQE